ncbi:phorbol esters/diacylglycerol binding domain protein, partial [Ostertagia ostertagi]
MVTLTDLLWLQCYVRRVIVYRMSSLARQAARDLRRTRSESQLVAKALDSISISSSVSGGMEDEVISVYTLSSLGSEPTNDQLMPTLDDIVDHDGTLTPSVLTPRAKDDTLTPGMRRWLRALEKEVGMQLVCNGDGDCWLAPLLTNAPGTTAESVSSIASSLSLATEDGAEEDGGLNRNRPSSTRKQRLHVALQASKRKVLDLMQKRRPVTPSTGVDNVEMGADAGDLEGGTDPGRESPLPPNGKRSPVEMQVVDKKEKRKKGKKILRHRLWASLNRKTTKSVHFRENVLWGQSLHYELDGTSSSPSKASCKYLNITVHAKEAPTTSPAVPTEASPGSAQAASVPEMEPPKPILLGYTSLYVPQILDDCQLTLSNCHREAYPLKPPTGIQSINEPSTSEFSRHAGHDPRLCYGDVTLGFRFFPGGLPQGAGTTGTEESDEEVRIEETLEGAKPSMVSPATVNSSSQHDWKAWSSKSGSAMCSMCRGKIWLKSASRCHRCLVVCHHKCVEKAASGIPCTPHAITQGDTEFAELDVDVNEQRTECPTSVIPVTPQTTQPPVSARILGEDVELTSRRTRLRNKMTEKFTSWRRGGKPTTKLELDGSSGRDSHLPESSSGTAVEGEELLSPMASIQECLADVLPTLDGSPFIRSLYFQPGNAYNEQTISHAKVLGREIFSNLKGEERKAKINEQIDRIQLAIRETKDGRLEAMKKDGTEGKAGGTFEGLDERLQALAVLMLHYCAALQDCESQGRESPVYDSEVLPEASVETHSLSV